MSFERSRISRRDLIKGTATTILLGASLTKGPELTSATIDYAYKKTKEISPYLKESIEDSSMFLGVYPHANNLQNIRYPNNFRMVGYFSPWHDWTAGIKNHIITDEQKPIISIVPFFENARKRPFRYKDLVEQKNHIKQQSRSLTSYPHCLIRYGYEMNGDWFPHGSTAQSPQEFIDGWKLVTEIIKKEHPGAQTVWSPNVDYPIVPYYPIDNNSELEPDYVGLDGYNKHHLGPYHIRHFLPNPSFAHLFGKDVLTLQEMTDKPILITETGIDYGDNIQARKASLQWMADALNTAASYQKVIGVCVFAWNKSQGRLDYNEGNWGNILTDEFHETVEQNPFYATEPLALAV